MKQILIYIFSLVLLWSCTETSFESQNSTVRATQQADTIFIIDRDGKRWDVTHAQKRYGLYADQFQYGIGAFSIRPINDPQIISASDSGYPTDDETFIVLGVNLDGEKRAYALADLRCHEIANEFIADANVAVAY